LTRLNHGATVPKNTEIAVKRLIWEDREDGQLTRRV
jgi:hypothetical protein